MHINKLMLFALLGTLACGREPTSRIMDSDEAAESDDGATTESLSDPMFDPMPEGIDPTNDSPWIPIRLDSDNPEVCIEGCGEKINWNNSSSSPDGPFTVGPLQTPTAGTIPPYTRNGKPVSQNLSTIFDRFGPRWILEGVFGTQNGPQIPQSVPPSMVDIDVQTPPSFNPPSVNIPNDPANDLLSAFAAGSRWAYEYSVQMAEQVNRELTELRNTISASNAQLDASIKKQIESLRSELDSRRADTKRETDIYSQKSAIAASKALQKLPVVEGKNPRSKFQTDPGSTQGQALRRGSSYVESAQRNLSQITGAGEEAMAKGLIEKAGGSIKQADKAYTKGQNSLGNTFLKIAYALADASGNAASSQSLSASQRQRLSTVSILLNNAGALAASSKSKAAENNLKIAEKHLDVFNGNLVLNPASDFQWPLANDEGRGNITTQFGVVDNSHPQPHRGTDIGVAEGRTVVAPVDGIVTQTGYNAGGYGHYVVVESTTPDGRTLQSIFGHLSSGSVEAGDAVHSGDNLGLSGNTGSSTGPHLHIEVRDCTGMPACNALVKPSKGGPPAVNPEDFLQ